MATTPIISRSNYLTNYDPGTSPDSETTARIDARLLDLSAAVMRFIGWRENDAGNLTLASTAHTMLLGDDYALRDDRRLTLPLCPVSAVTDVRSGSDVGGTSGTDYDVLVAGTDYRLDTSEPARPALRWLQGEPSGEELRVTMTAGWATVPEDLQGAVAQLVRWSLQLDTRRGQASVSAQGMASTSYRQERWPDDVLAVLERYAVPPARVVRGPAAPVTRIAGGVG
jgi:hypothetical protein